MKKVMNRGALRRSMQKPLRLAAPSEGDISFTCEPFYRVVLVYNDWLNDKPIAQKVSYSVPVINSYDAVDVVKKARLKGDAIITTVIKDDAEKYMSDLTTKGLDVFIDEA